MKDGTKQVPKRVRFVPFLFGRAHLASRATYATYGNQTKGRKNPAGYTMGIKRDQEWMNTVYSFGR